MNTRLLLFIFLLFPTEAFLSGMASISVLSEYYSLYLDSGITISISPRSFGGPNNYFKEKEEKLLKQCETNIPIIDLWVLEEINTYKTQFVKFGNKGSNLELSYGCHASDDELAMSGKHRIRLSLETVPSSKTVTELQSRLCDWKRKYESIEVSPAKVIKTSPIIVPTTFGTLNTYRYNLREDLHNEFKATKIKNMERWKKVIKIAVDKVESKFKTKFLVERPENEGFIKKIDIGWAGIIFTTWADEADEQCVEDISWALPHYIAQEEYNLKLIDTLPKDTQKYFEDHKGVLPISSLERKAIFDSVMEMQKKLQETYSGYEVEISFNYGKSGTYPYRWDILNKLHLNLPLFERMISDVKKIGPKIQKNKVQTVEFNSSWEGGASSPNICINVFSYPSEKGIKYVMDVSYLDLEKSESEFEFYEILQGERAIRFNKDK